MDLELTMCVGNYDINRALLTGQVKPKGIRLITFTEDSPHRHWRMARHEEFDVSEFAMAKVTMLGSGGSKPRLVAIPAFPHRRFRHRFVYVRRESALRDLSQLGGLRIGLRSWQNTACMWVRGMLQDFYGVDLSTISWTSQDEEDLALAGPVPGSYARVPAGRDVFEMLCSGELDCVIYPEIPRAYLAADGPVRTLLPDPKQAEITFYQQTGIFPIMHTVVVRASVLERYPWAAVNLLDAFRESKDLAFKTMLNPRSVSLAWFEEARLEQLELLGADPWRYNFEDNREQLEMMVRWSNEQAMSTGVLSAASLFAPSTIDEAPSLVGG
jgi:4,5-dihydroxyphthalate decarboxylase